MALRRRLRKAGNSLAVTIPSLLAEMCGFRPGDIAEVEAIGHDALRLSKAREGGVDSVSPYERGEIA